MIWVEWNKKIKMKATSFLFPFPDSLKLLYPLLGGPHTFLLLHCKYLLGHGALSLPPPPPTLAFAELFLLLFPSFLSYMNFPWSTPASAVGSTVPCSGWVGSSCIQHGEVLASPQRDPLQPPLPTSGRLCPVQHWLRCVKQGQLQSFLAVMQSQALHGLLNAHI